ncbi:MAG: chromosome segregation protein SMC [Planctomycetes bacterium]|nr:chromosome segregation protein SMC [Planctomycetota bacterium]
MRLKSVELFGFKSFPDRTVIEFGQGITAILGPNGCGKSNVVDAIKWVLGEKSAKNLRGEEMLDVIFSGCETRSPSGMAEVKLHFDNSDQRLALPYTEICVGRRLYRSRESEYFINNNRCRLRDIRDLFLDTGIGSSAYSVIEQGRVEALLHAKPADRRAVFEEAAGIAKFKVKRKEILSRLERTSQILLRVSDRVEEKERQIRKVATQAANARRHRRLTAQRDGARKHLYQRQFAEHCSLLRDLARQREALDADLDGEERSLAALTAEFTAVAAQEAEITANRDAVIEAAASTQEDLSAIQLEQAHARSRIEALTGDITRGNERRAELTARRNRLTALEAETRGLLEEAGALARRLDERFGQQDAERQALLQAAAAAEEATTLLRTQTIDVNARRQQWSAEAARLEASEQSAAARMAAIDARLAAIREEEMAVGQAVADLETRYGEAAAAAGAAVDRLEAIRHRLTEGGERLRRLQAEEQSGASERAAKASRKATLEDLENSFDGAYEGVKNILTAARDRQEFRGIVGMALDLMTVPQDLALAVETILGASAQDVVVETARDAQAAIEYLKRHRLGRATFLPLDRIQPRRRLTTSLRHIPGVIGEAVDLVSFDARHRTVMEYLLAGILVVDNLGLARELAGREARGVKIVTLEGDIVSPSGAMTGGHGRQRRAGLVQRKAELDALIQDLAACEARLAETARLRGQAAEAVTVLEREKTEVESALAEAGRSEAGLAQSLAVRKSELDRLTRDRAEGERERESLSAGDGGRREELADLRHRLAEAEAELTRLEGELAAKTAEQIRTRQTIDALGQEFATLSGERSAALSRVRELETRLAEIGRDLAACQEELDRPGLSNAEAENAIAAFRRQVEELDRREVELLRLRDERKATGTELSERLVACRERGEALRQREREIQAQTARLREGLAVIDRHTAESTLRLENIQQKAAEELQLTLTIPEPHGHQAEAVDGGLPAPTPAAEEPEAPPEMTAEWAALDDAHLQALVEEFSQKIRNIVSVTLEAIDELAELEAGAEFLRSHKEEQEEAVATMRQAIERLNQESSTRFQETFVAVRENFQQMFTRLFGGGKADLVLEEVTDPEADPLDAGIDISAQPPGKEPKSISLLSGGEKALCAVALLFALFRTKPSPFCILDEVDGPLDESNIDRFMQQVKDFTGDTQFIIITHSQRTMGMTDEIWGVTQKVPGISTLASLKFDAMEDMSREKAADRGMTEDRQEARSA